jgi:uncharacterized repeat protein (TIGR01451 family)
LRSHHGDNGYVQEMSGRTTQHFVTRTIGAAVFSAVSVALTATAGTAVAVIPDVPADVTYQCFADVPTPAAAAIEDADDPVTPDNPVVPTDVPSDATATFQGDITRTWEFFDGDATQTITVADTIAPVATAPADVTVVGAAGIPALATIPAVDNCDGPVTSDMPTDASAPGGTPNDQTITRTWGITDLAGNPTTVTQTITVVPAAADLRITATASPNPVTAGENLVYTITVDNIGTAIATGVQVATAAIPDATTAGCANDPAGVALCTLGDIAAGDDATYTVTVGVGPAATGSLSQTWTVSTTSPDLNPANDVAATNAVITTSAVMTIAAAATVTGVPNDTTSTTPGATGAPGDPVDVSITVANNGPSDARNATVTATFTSNVGGLAVLDSGAYTCQIDAQVLTCTTASHPAGDTVVIRLGGALTGTSTDIFLGDVVVDSDDGEAVSATGVVVVIPAETTTTLATTTTLTPATTAAAPATPVAATGTNSDVVLRVSLIALFAGIAATIIARRKPELAAAALHRVGISRGPASDTAQPVRRVNANGVSTVIEEPPRSTDRT